MQQQEPRAQDVQVKQRKKHALDPSVQVERVRKIKTRRGRSPLIESHEILKVVAFLMANVICRIPAASTTIGL